jgi:hypothetical protein
MDRYKFASVCVKQDWSDCIGAALLHLLSFGQKKILHVLERKKRQSNMQISCRTDLGCIYVLTLQVWYNFVQIVYRLLWCRIVLQKRETLLAVPKRRQIQSIWILGV